MILPSTAYSCGNPGKMHAQPVGVVRCAPIAVLIFQLRSMLLAERQFQLSFSE